MHYGHFILYATLGAGVWNMILATLGYYFHSIVPEEHLNDKIMEYGEVHQDRHHCPRRSCHPLLRRKEISIR